MWVAVVNAVVTVVVADAFVGVLSITDSTSKTYYASSEYDLAYCCEVG